MRVIPPKEINRAIELLSPAKDLNCGIEAVNHGADAVYIGAPRYGARAAAGNPVQDIEKLISYAHRFWAKVYITLNTILFDHELNDALKIIKSVYEAGADALIIQDFGLMELDMPPIQLFASTQMHNSSPEKIMFLEKTGFSRVILARELSLKEIKVIKEKTKIDLECFIHGALCVCYSGQCYLSQAVQGRSANRGECAQPCRLPYSVTDASGKYLIRNKYPISLKDLNLSEYLDDLIKAGVRSFKIEGRLKDVDYVKNVTAFYRKKLDKIMDKNEYLDHASSGNIHVSFEPDPSRTFNRGFTEYFIEGRKKDVVSMNSPKSIGALLGKVRSVINTSVVIDTKEECRPGDGICYYDEAGVLCGTNIVKVDGNVIYLSKNSKIKAGTSVYRNYDKAFSKLLQANKCKRTIEVKMILKENGSGFILSIEDEDGIKAAKKYEAEKVPAKKDQLAESSVRHQLVKLGDSIYFCKNPEIKWTKPYFIPVALINKMRREVILILNEERLKRYQRLSKEPVIENEQYPFKKLDYTANVSNEKAAAFFKRHGVISVDPAFELGKEHAGKAIMTIKNCIRFQLGICGGKSEQDAEALFLLDGRNRFRLEFNCSECKMNVVFV